MGRMAISDLKAGMLLQQAVLNEGGALLLKEGQNLTDKNIGILKKWGVKEVLIQEDAGATSVQAGPQNLEAYEAWKTQTLSRFLSKEQDPIMQAIAVAALPLVWMDFRKTKPA